MQSRRPPSRSDPTPQLKRLYLNYTCKGTRSKLDVLSSAKFIQLLRDAGVIEPGFSLHDADILVSKVIRRANIIAFPAFCELIGRIAKAKFEDVYSRISPSAALEKFIQKYIVPLYQAEMLDFDRFEGLEITPSCLCLLNETKEVLTEMYVRSFPWELHSAEENTVITQHSESTLLNLTLGFGIVPEFITKSAAIKVLYSTLSTSFSLTAALSVPNQGRVLTLDKFLVYLFRCAAGNTGFSSASSMHINLALLFEVMEMSLGFQSFESVSSRTHTAKMTLMTPSVVAALEPILHPEKPQSQEMDLNAIPITSEQLDLHIESLEQIYQAYCSYGEPLNLSHMKAYKFLRILTDAGLLTASGSAENSFRMSEKLAQSNPESRGKISKNDANLIFIKVTTLHRKHSEVKIPTFKPTNYLAAKDSEHGRMTFPQFLQGLSRVAKLVYSDLQSDEAVLALLENHILKLENVLVGHGISYEKIKQLLGELKGEPLQQVMAILTKCLEPFYPIYSDSKGFANLEKFIRFCVDFEIFPDVISKAKLVQFFAALASVYKKTSLGLTATLSLTKGSSNELPIDQTDTDVIDLNLFIDGVALCAVEGLFPEPTHEGKLVALLERMSQSKGPGIAQRSSGLTRNSAVANLDFLKILSEFYPQLQNLQASSSFVGFQAMVGLHQS